MRENKIRKNMFHMFGLESAKIYLLEINQLYSMVHLLSGVIVCVFISSVIGLDPWPDQTKEIEISILCSSAKHAAVRRMSKDWSAKSPNNVTG